MRTFRADLHIHSLLSPCGSLDMTPSVIVSEAVRRGLDIIAVSDHNTTHHCELTVELGREAGITVLRAAEVTSNEEVHSLVILPDSGARADFQAWLDSRSARQPYDPALFGYQVVIDRDENIIREIDYFLTSALKASLSEIEKEAHRIGALFIPAHIDRPSFSITSQLGFLPADLNCDALETIGAVQAMGYPFIRNSDAHIPEHIGRRNAVFMLESPTFGELCMALRSEKGRMITSVEP